MMFPLNYLKGFSYPDYFDLSIELIQIQPDKFILIIRYPISKIQIINFHPKFRPR